MLLPIAHRVLRWLNVAGIGFGAASMLACGTIQLVDPAAPRFVQGNGGTFLVWLFGLDVAVFGLILCAGLRRLRENLLGAVCALVGAILIWSTIVALATIARTSAFERERHEATVIWASGLIA